jgi:hypothetical protein
MSISSDLFMAILAMDSYNRGYDAGVNLDGRGIGTATLLDKNLLTGSQSASFYAQAYNMADGTTVISYRGTDQKWPDWEKWTLGDVWNGWGLGRGSPAGDQAELAVEFYKVVAAGLPLEANIALTGHSLGGGLAGFVGSLYGKNATIFDNEPFERAAAQAYMVSVGSYAGLNFGYDAIRESIYGTAEPWDVNRSGVKAYAVSGEILAAARLAERQTTPVETFNTGSLLWPVGDLSPFDRHGQALLVILQYAQEPGVSGAGWQAARPYLLGRLFDNEIALAAKADRISGVSKETGDFAGIMRTALAYSAIDEGVRPFGDTGIRSLYNDADDLGLALGAEGASRTLLTAASAISKVLLQPAS